MVEIFLAKGLWGQGIFNSNIKNHSIFAIVLYLDVFFYGIQTLGLKRQKNKYHTQMAFLDHGIKFLFSCII